MSGHIQEASLFFKYLGEEEYLLDVQTISQFISTIGFPIVAAGAMFWLNYKTIPTLNQIAELLREVEKLLMEVERLDND